MGFKERYQLLCANHNWIKRKEDFEKYSYSRFVAKMRYKKRKIIGESNG